MGDAFVGNEETFGAVSSGFLLKRIRRFSRLWRGRELEVTFRPWPSSIVRKMETFG